jgi:predicted  nucleic acid-binding Zn-ribbon protein
MGDLVHDIHLLVSIAKADAIVARNTNELASIPAASQLVTNKLEKLSADESAAVSELEALNKERRVLDTALEDHASAIVKSKNQLAVVKTNKEYTAALKEIETLEGEIDGKEGRVLELMDEVDAAEEKSQSMLALVAGTRSQLEAKKAELDGRESQLTAEVEKLRGEKPKLISEIDEDIRKKYERLLKRYGDQGVTTVQDQFCGGCGTELPPQVVVEVKTNTQLMNCQGCGRILIYYTD